MSWLDLIQNNLVITTGDGKQFTPSWLNATKVKDFNISEFEFPNVDGTLVKRGRPLGRKYALEIYFQGDDHITQADDFDFSSNDPRPWKINHPFYGNIIVQPTSLAFDNTAFNLTKITGLVIETIVDNNPTTTINIVDSIATLQVLLMQNFSDQLVNPAPSDIAPILYNNKRNFNVAIPIIKLPKEFEEYNQLFNQANAAVNNALAYPKTAITLTLAFITKPAMFTSNLQTRINTLQQQFENLRVNVNGLTSVSSKQFYQTFAGGVVAAILFGSSLPLIAGDVITANQVLAIIDQVTGIYSNYRTDLDSIQSPNGGNPSYFIPDANSQITLNDLFNQAISNLFRIALTSKQQRTLLVECDTNIILLTHRLYGLDPFDNNINELMAENNLGLNSILQIKKNTPISYYI
jgi:hypothetical protein